MRYNDKLAAIRRSIMTTTSHPWKQVLERQAKALQELMKPHRISEATTVKLEETVVLGCYTIRRLINGFLLPESLRNHPFPMSAFPRRPQSTSLLDDEPLRIRYDLEASRPVQHEPIFLCHQVLQNCVFEPWLTTDHQLTGIYVTSDHQHKIALYGVSLESLKELFHHLSVAP
jgi:hypothetical protein